MAGKTFTYILRAGSSVLSAVETLNIFLSTGMSKKILINKKKIVDIYNNIHNNIKPQTWKKRTWK